MRNRKNTVITVVFMIILAAGIIAGYFFLVRGKDSENYEGQGMQDEAEKLLLRDLDTSYPATPREVVKLYSRMMKCYYNGGLKEEKIEAMAAQMRKLFDEELLEANPNDVYMPDLKDEIEDYAANKRTITSYQVETANNVVTWTSEEREYARLVVNYTYKEDQQYFKVYEEFVLRRDETERWRILGWRLAEKEDME
ncbi:MAG: hypothetical protein K2N94_04945 [Lachnospiraceae bacterium]|nr:hypothetical protein [Lachnospiraceae bacterium]